MSYLNNSPTEVDNAAYPQTQGSGPSTSYQVPQVAPDIASDGPSLEEARSHPRHDRRNPKPSKMRKLAPAGPTQRAGPSRPARVTTTPAAGKGTTKSKLALKKEKLGASGGIDFRKRAPIKVEHGVLYSLIGNEWKRAGYHSDFREQLIRKDAQQAGAPAFHKGMPLDITSYCPITRDWTEDPHTMRDSKGRQALLIPQRPADWKHNPKHGHLMYEGLVLLDQNDRPIEDHPGAPLTMGSSSSDLPGYLILGLQRYFGMTYSDMVARTPPERLMANGSRVQRTTTLSNRVQHYVKREENLALGMKLWHKRKLSKVARLRDTIQPGRQDDEPEATEPFSDSAVPEPDQFPGANGMSNPPEGHDLYDQLDEMYAEQTTAENDSSAPAFSFANFPQQTANQAAPESIYSLGNPYDSAHQNIYPPTGGVYSLGTMDGELTSGSNHYNAPAFSSADMPLETTNEVAPETIYSPGIHFEPGHHYVYPPSGGIYSPGDPIGYVQTDQYNNSINDDFWNLNNFR